MSSVCQIVITQVLSNQESRKKFVKGRECLRELIAAERSSKEWTFGSAGWKSLVTLSSGFRAKARRPQLDLSGPRTEEAEVAL